MKPERRVRFVARAKSSIGTFCAISIMLLGLVGCVTTKDRVELPVDVPNSWVGVPVSDALPMTGGLLDLIEDESLRKLVEAALENNQNLKATALRLKAEGLLLAVPRSRLLPALSGELSAGRNNQGMDVETGGPSVESSHRLALNMNWELDLWGRLADEYAAAIYTYKSQEEQFMQAADFAGGARYSGLGECCCFSKGCRY